MKILLIDDEQALLKVFTETLETLGHFDVVTAQTGNEGVEKVRSEQPDLVLLDQVLPDINGNQILQMIKQDPSTKNIPVAMLSNFNQDNLVQEAINLGALDYILKYQVEPEDLVAKINKLVKEFVKQPSIENAIPLPAVKPVSEPAVPVAATTTSIPQQVQPQSPATTSVQPPQAQPVSMSHISTEGPVMDAIPQTPAQPKAEAIPQIDHVATQSTTPTPDAAPLDLNKLLNN